MWPARQETAETAAWIAFGSALWVGFATLTMFDMMMVTWTLLGMIGITHAARGALRHGFTLLGVAIGLGVLTKGPVILLHVLPAAVLAPWWLTDPRPPYKSWYLSILGVRRTIRPRWPHSWAAECGRNQAKSAWRTKACCSWMSCRNFRNKRSMRCASRLKLAKC